MFWRTGVRDGSVISDWVVPLPRASRASDGRHALATVEFCGGVQKRGYCVCYGVVEWYPTDTKSWSNRSLFILHTLGQGPTKLCSILPTQSQGPTKHCHAPPTLNQGPTNHSSTLPTLNRSSTKLCSILVTINHSPNKRCSTLPTINHSPTKHCSISPMHPWKVSQWYVRSGRHTSGSLFVSLRIVIPEQPHPTSVSKPTDRSGP